MDEHARIFLESISKDIIEIKDNVKDNNERTRNLEIKVATIEQSVNSYSKRSINDLKTSDQDKEVRIRKLEKSAVKNTLIASFAGSLFTSVVIGLILYYIKSGLS